MKSGVRVGALLVAALALAIGCGGEREREQTSSEGAARAEADAPEPTRPKRRERPLPAFSGTTLEEERIDIASMLGRRLVVFFFDPSATEAPPVASALARVAELGDEHNFSVVGVAMGGNRSRSRAFVEEHGVEFPVIDDSARQIATRFGMKQPLAMIGVDAEGYMVWVMAQFPVHAPEPDRVVEAEIREVMRIPEAGDAGPLAFPKAPGFTATTLEGNQPYDFADTKGAPRVLIFFLHWCPHCHEALAFLKETLADLPEDKRPPLVGLELSGQRDKVRAEMAKHSLDFFPVVFDDSQAATNAYGVFGGVPDIMLIDGNDRIVHRISGWNPEVDGPQLRMRLAKLAGAPVPMLLRSEGYTGSEVCGICHTSEHQTWQLTTHARAYDTLVTHGVDTDPECVGCHVVGFEEAGGFSITTRRPELEDVGCESCHGRGGPHLSPAFVTDDDYQPVCVGCHDQKHSLGFAYDTFLPKVSHAANAELLTLPADELQRIMAERGAIRSDLLPTNAEHVGSEACQSCHAQEHATWSTGPHANALASLEAQGKAGEDDCRTCHTTGFGRTGGFPPGGDPAAHSDLARVGCESCHGPGGNHVAEGSTKLGSIVSLGDKCDSCVILQICGSCHDDANDPGFEFEVQDKIDQIRHGSIEAGTGKAKDPASKSSGAGSADSAAHLSHADRALLAGVFHAQGQRAEGSWIPR